MIISIVYYYLLLAIPPFPIIFLYCFSDFGLLFSNKFLQLNVPATQQPPIIGTKVKPKQEPPQTPQKPWIWIVDHPEDNTQLCTSLGPAAPLSSTTFWIMISADGD